jgi:hypothetical protein
MFSYLSCYTFFDIPDTAAGPASSSPGFQNGHHLLPVVPVPRSRTVRCTSVKPPLAKLLRGVLQESVG